MRLEGKSSRPKVDPTLKVESREQGCGRFDVGLVVSGG